MMLKLLLQTLTLLLLSLGLGECSDCDEVTSSTIYTLMELLESDPSVQKQVSSVCYFINVNYMYMLFIFN